MLWYIRPSIVTVGEALDWLETCVSCAVVEAVVAALLCFDGFPPMVKNEKEGEEEEERCLYFFFVDSWHVARQQVPLCGWGPSWHWVNSLRFLSECNYCSLFILLSRSLGLTDHARTTLIFMFVYLVSSLAHCLIPTPRALLYRGRLKNNANRNVTGSKTTVWWHHHMIRIYGAILDMAIPCSRPFALTKEINSSSNTSSWFKRILLPNPHLLGFKNSSELVFLFTKWSSQKKKKDNILCTPRLWKNSPPSFTKLSIMISDHCSIVNKVKCIFPPHYASMPHFVVVSF